MPRANGSPAVLEIVARRAPSTSRAASTVELERLLGGHRRVDPHRGLRRARGAARRARARAARPPGPRGSRGGRSRTSTAPRRRTRPPPRAARRGAPASASVAQRLLRRRVVRLGEVEHAELGADGLAAERVGGARARARRGAPARRGTPRGSARAARAASSAVGAGSAIGRQPTPPAGRIGVSGRRDRFDQVAQYPSASSADARCADTGPRMCATNERRPGRGRGRRLAAERGVTLIETLFSAVVARDRRRVRASSRRSTRRRTPPRSTARRPSPRRLAEQELERMRSLSAIELATTPARRRRRSSARRSTRSSRAPSGSTTPPEPPPAADSDGKQADYIRITSTVKSAIARQARQAGRADAASSRRGSARSAPTRARSPSR